MEAIGERIARIKSKHDWEGPDVEEIIFAGYNEDGSVKPE